MTTALLLALMELRAWDAWRGPPLRLWHIYVPRELDVEKMKVAPTGPYGSPPSGA